MNIANGWKTYTVGIAAILAAALGAVPSGWTNDETAGILGFVMIVLRAITVAPAGISINRTFALPFVALLALGGSGLVGCMQFAKQIGLTATDCAITQAALDIYTPALSQECASGSGKSKEKACTKLRALDAAMAVCLASTVPVAPAEVAVKKDEILAAVPVPAEQ